MIGKEKQCEGNLSTSLLEGLTGSDAARSSSSDICDSGDQPGYPKDAIESFVGHSSMGLLCPPAAI